MILYKKHTTTSGVFLEFEDTGGLPSPLMGVQGNPLPGLFLMNKLWCVAYYVLWHLFYPFKRL